VIRSITRTQLVVDIVVAGVLLLLVIWSAAANAPLIGPIVAVLFCVALAIRRLSPPLALIGVWVAAVGQMVTLQAATAADIAVLGVAFATAAYGSRTVRWLGLASAVVGGVLSAFYLTFATRDSYFSVTYGVSHVIVNLVALSIGMVTLFGLSWTLGLLARTVRQSREARIQAAVEAQRAAYESAVEQERTTIARDMHDVVAHSLAVVIAQADGARYAGAEHPDVQADALGTISATARSALAEVRVLLTQLRREEPDGPQPSLDDVPALVAGMRQAGLLIVESHSGKPVPLLQGSALAAFRILQEALTNALRHGEPSRPVAVELTWTPDALRIRVRNAIRRESAQTVVIQGEPAGHGLPGMRERAALAGGTITVGTIETTEPSYEVVAVLPAATRPEVAS
jgi:signal transduction histidine kinase